MGYCPQCHSEYKEGIKVCSDCHIPLVIEEEASKEDVTVVTSIEPVLLVSTIAQLDGDILLTLLEEAGIAAFKKDKGIGEYMRVYMGYSIYGADIYVEQSAYPKAKEILDAFLAEADESFQDYTKERKEEEVSPSGTPFLLSSRVAMRIVLGLVVVGVILAAVI